MIHLSPMAHAIEVAGLTKRFGSVLAVDDLSFTADEGRVVGFLGPNGAGKTTTLRMLLGLVNPTQGSATINGQPFTALQDPVHTVGAVLDGGMLHPGPQRPQPPARARARGGIGDQRVDELLELVALSDAANRRAGGYSLGMRQRLGLAAALLGDPRVLVLDEPANGLDPQGIRWLRDFLQRLAGEGRAILVSSHVLAEVSQTVDDVVVISKGRSVRQAPLHEIMAASGGGASRRRPGRAPARGHPLRAGRDGQRDAGADHRAGAAGEEIGRVIAEHQIVISELAPVESSLEDIYFELTGQTGGPS